MNQMRGEIMHLGMNQLFRTLAIPGIIGTLILGLYNFVDAIFVGQFIGSEALGGVTLVYAVVLMNQAILTLLGMGSMALLSIAVGKKDYQTINQLFGTLIIVLGALSLVFAVSVYVFSKEIIQFLGGQGSIAEYGQDYLRVLSIGFIFAALGPAINMLFRGEGLIKSAMKILSMGVFINIILDFIFIYGLSWGVKGAAGATVISQAIVLGMNIAFIVKGKSVISLKRSEFKVSFRLLPKIMEIGSATMILLIMASIQQIMLFRALATYNDPTLIALLGAGYRVLLFAVLPFTGIGQGLQSIIGINYGAGKNGRVKEAYRIFTRKATWIAGVLWLLFMIFPGRFLELMITDQRMVDIGIPYFRLMFVMFLFSGLINTSATLFQALGKGRKASLIFLSRQLLFFIPLLLILPNYFGIQGIWMAMPAAELLTVLMIIFMVRSEFRTLHVPPGQQFQVATGQTGTTR